MKSLILCLLIVQATFGSQRLLGGWDDVDMSQNDENSMFSQAVNEVVEHINNIQNTLSTIHLIRVVRAKQQLVNGMNYVMTLELGHTNCFKNQANQDPTNCAVQQVQTCRVKAYRPFSGPTTVSWMNCGQLSRYVVREKKHLLGGLEPGSTGEAKEALVFATEALNSKSNGFYELSVHDIKKVQKQVVAGIKYYVTLVFRAKSCEEGRPLTWCSANNQVEELMECKVEVVDQAWMTPRFTLLKHGCESQSTQVGRLYFSGQGARDATGDNDVLSVRRLQGMSSSESFQLFKMEFGKKYDTEEEENKRMKIFSENLEKAHFYQVHDLGTAVYGATPLSDLTEEEFRQKYLTKEWDPKSRRGLMKAEIPHVKDLPKEFDWRNLSAVSPVKNQGSCGSCWAFCVVGNIEGAWAIKHKELYNLSAQELVDCDQLDMGCNGGLPDQAYQEIQRLGGLMTEEDYPYHGKEGACALKKDSIKVQISGAVNISSNEDEMAAWLVSNNPMAIGINALAMQFYRGGISHPWDILCPKALNHGVVIVGYGVKKGWLSDTPYWIIKNSWGENWGEKGYYLVFRGSGVCGLNLMVSSAVVN